MLTGESVPVEVGAGDTVTGATVERRRPPGGRAPPAIGADTQLARMAKLVEDAQNGKAAGPAARGPNLRGVRADRHRRSRIATLGFWLGTGAGTRGGLHGGRRRA
ncbi:hypothetical protein ACU686_22285 [Yinghuangia aomiensis]